MKHLKNFNLHLEIGDHVICTDSMAFDLIEFISDNVGEYIAYKDYEESEYPYIIKYENIPDEIEEYFDNLKGYKNCRDFSIDEIKKKLTPEEYEEYLMKKAVKKYNIG